MASGQPYATAVLFTRGKDPGIHWIGGWVCLKTSLEREAREKSLYLCRGLNPGRPVCSQTL